MTGLPTRLPTVLGKVDYIPAPLIQPADPIGQTTATVNARVVSGESLEGRFRYRPLTYLYEEGNEVKDWVEGYSTGTGDQNKEDDHLHVWAEDATIGERTWVIDEPIDLTNISKIWIDWENVGDDNAGNASVFIVSTSKTAGSGTYNARLMTSRDFTRTESSLDVSEESGLQYIRVHAKDAHSLTAVRSEINVYKVWLERAWTEQPTAKDTYLSGHEPTNQTTKNFGDYEVMLVRAYPGDVARSILEFPKLTLPPGAEITSAILSLHHFMYSTNSPEGRTYWVYKLTRTDWEELEATWVEYKEDAEWDTLGGDYVTINPSGASSVVPSAPNWMTWDVLDIVQDAYSNDVPIEFLIKDDNEEDEELEKTEAAWFRTKEYETDPDLHPILVIVYKANWVETPWDNGLTTDDPFSANLTDLDEDTEYEFQAQLRGNGLESEWSDCEFFTTLSILTLTPSGILQAISLGEPTLDIVHVITPSGIPQTFVFGEPDASLTIRSPPGILQPISLGSPDLAIDLTLSPEGIAQGVTLGTPDVISDTIVTPSGISQGVSLGEPSVLSDTVLTLAGIRQPITLGTPSLVKDKVLTPEGIVQSITLGEPDVVSDAILTPSGIRQGITLGEPSLVVDTVVTPSGIEQKISLGSPDLIIGTILTPEGIQQGTSLGTPTLLPDTILTPEGISQPVNFGTPTVQTAHFITPNGIEQTITLGSPDLIIDTILTPEGIQQGTSLGTPILITDTILTPDGIEQTVSFGEPTLIVPPAGSILPASNILTDEARIRAEVSDDGGAECEGRFRWAPQIQIALADDFEWGSDGDPLDDSGGDITWSIFAPGDSKTEISTAQAYQGTRSARLYRAGEHAVAYIYGNPLAGNQAIEFMVRRNDTGWFAVRSGDGTRRINFRISSDGSIHYYNAGGIRTATGSSVAHDTWHKIAFRDWNFTAGTYDIYLDGDLIANAEMQETHLAAEELHFWSYDAGSETFLDNIRVLERDWTETPWENGLSTNDEFYADIAGLEHSTEYVYQAQVKNSAGESEWTDEETFTTDVLITPDGIEQAVSFGEPTLVTDTVLSPEGIGQSVSLGTPNVIAEGVITPSGIGQSVSLGEPSLAIDTIITPEGIAQSVTFGTPAVLSVVIVTPDGIAQSISFGIPGIIEDRTLTPAGIEQSISLGGPSVISDTILTPSGIGQPVSLGAPQIIATVLLTPAGIAQGVTLGEPVVKLILLQYIDIFINMPRTEYRIESHPRDITINMNRKTIRVR